MKNKNRIIHSIGGTLMVCILTACNMPIKSATPFVFPTANATTANTQFVPLPVTATLGVQANTQSPSATAFPTDTYTPQPPPTLTFTPTATATNVPPTPTRVPPTATLPVARSNSYAVAPFISNAPTIDGSWSDLPSSSESPANTVVYRNPSYTGDPGTGMSYRIGWDNKYLYIGVKVWDILYRQVETGDKIYLGDSIEVLIDTNVSGDFFDKNLSNDDYQLGISPGYKTPGNQPEAYLWYPSGKTGSRTDVKIGVLHPATDLYRIEFAIPWSLLGVTPTDGMHLGFAISYSDNQSEVKSEQDLMISNDPNRSLADPTTWGDLTLTS